MVNFFCLKMLEGGAHLVFFKTRKHACICVVSWWWKFGIALICPPFLLPWTVGDLMSGTTLDFSLSRSSPRVILVNGTVVSPDGENPLIQNAVIIGKECRKYMWTCGPFFPRWLTHTTEILFTFSCSTSKKSDWSIGYLVEGSEKKKKKVLKYGKYVKVKAITRLDIEPRNCWRPEGDYGLEPELKKADQWKSWLTYRDSFIS